MTNRTRWLGYFLAVLIGSAGWLMLREYREHRERMNQLEAQVLLQAWRHAIEQHRAATGNLPSREKIAEAVHGASLVDPWGSPLHHSSTGGRYVVASMGRDCRLDVARLEDYFETAEVEMVQRQYDRDIVLVDGEFVRNAGK